MRLPLAITLLLVAASASAQTDPFRRGFDAVPLKFTPTLNGGLLLEGGELLNPGAWQAQALFDLNWNFLALKVGNARVGDLLPFRWDVRLSGAWQPFKRFDFAAELPVTLYQANQFNLLEQQGFPQTAPAKVGLGDLRLISRFQIIRQAEVGLGLAAVLEVRLPTSIGKDEFLGDRGVVLSPRLAAERSFGPLRLLANVGWRLRTTYGQFVNVYVGQEFLLGAGLGFRFPDFWKISTPTLYGEFNTSTAAEAPFTFASNEALKTPMEIALGLKAVAAKDWALTFALARGLSAGGYGREQFRLTFGLAYLVNPQPDADGDGISDNVDQCPLEPEDKDGYQDSDGCPEPDPDSDGDGVPDHADGCKDQPGPNEYDGCPDRDGDQIPDNVDKCPDEPGPAETEGCPVPPEEEVTLESDRIRIKGNILFETGKAVIEPQSFRMLDDVAKVLLDNRDVGPVLIEGHTDNRGSRPFNIDLSKRRAGAVEDYLVGKGVEKSRLRSDGFGFDRPVATNDTPLGRAKNRRTDFRLVDEDKDGEKKGTKKPKPDAAPKPDKPPAGKPPPTPGPAGVPKQALPDAAPKPPPATPAPAIAPKQALPDGGPPPKPPPATPAVPKQALPDAGPAPQKATTPDAGVQLRPPARAAGTAAKPAAPTKGPADAGRPATRAEDDLAPLPAPKR